MTSRQGVGCDAPGAPRSGLPTTVIYDHQAFVMQRWGGISRYFAELVKNLESYLEIRPLVVAPWANNGSLENTLGIRSRSLSAHYRHRGVGKLMAFESKLDQRAVRGTFAQHPGAVYHPTYYDPFLLTKDFKNPVVITIHDMIYELFPHEHPGVQVVQQKKEMIERADHIVVVSESTRADLIRFYPEAAEKSSVIHHGVSFSASSSDEQTLIEGDYLLFVGARTSYKNFKRFAQAFSALAVQYPALKLVCTGGGRFSREETRIFKEAGLIDRVILREVSDEQLKNLYRNAQAFVFPSLYEGFGLPILEAMSCGAPCVLNDIPVFHEVASDAACYCDARGSHDIEQAIGTILEDSELQDRLRLAGYERARGFSWARCAQAHAALYQELDRDHVD